MADIGQVVAGRDAQDVARTGVVLALAGADYVVATQFARVGRDFIRHAREVVLIGETVLVLTEEQEGAAAVTGDVAVGLDAILAVRAGVLVAPGVLGTPLAVVNRDRVEQEDEVAVTAAIAVDPESALDVGGLVTDGLVAQYDAMTLVRAEDDPVGNWPSSVPGPGDIVTLFGGTYKGAGMDGLPAITGMAFLTVSGNLGQVPPMTVFQVVKLADASTAHLELGAGTAANSLNVIPHSGVAGPLAVGTGTPTLTPGWSGKAVLGVRANDAGDGDGGVFNVEYTGFLNGVEGSTGVLAEKTAIATTLWQLIDGNDFYSELLVYNRALSDAEMIQVSEYLMEKWGFV